MLRWTQELQDEKDSEMRRDNKKEAINMLVTVWLADDNYLQIRSGIWCQCNLIGLAFTTELLTVLDNTEVPSVIPLFEDKHKLAKVSADNCFDTFSSLCNISFRLESCLCPTLSFLLVFDFLQYLVANGVCLLFGAGPVAYSELCHWSHMPAAAG